VEATNPYMEQVVQLDLDRSDLPVRDILLESEGNQRRVAKRKKNLDLEGTQVRGREEIKVTRVFRYLGWPWGPAKLVRKSLASAADTRQKRARRHGMF
jgi:hypothetical protein